MSSTHKAVEGWTPERADQVCDPSESFIISQRKANMNEAHDVAMLELCERFFAATASGDLDAVRAMYAPDAITWHNHDGVEQSVEQTLRVLAALPRVLKDFRYEDARRSATATGFIEQHTVRGTTAAGVDLAIPACIVCTVVDGRIVRLDEYLDSAQIAPLAHGR